MQKLAFNMVDNKVLLEDLIMHPRPLGHADEFLSWYQLWLFARKYRSHQVPNGLAVPRDSQDGQVYLATPIKDDSGRFINLQEIIQRAKGPNGKHQVIIWQVTSDADADQLAGQLVSMRRFGLRVGIGSGELNDHPGDDDDGKRNFSAADLVAMKLGVAWKEIRTNWEGKREPRLMTNVSWLYQLLGMVRRADREATQGISELGRRLKGWMDLHDEEPNNPDYSIEELIRTTFAEFNRHRGMGERFDSNIPYFDKEQDKHVVNGIAVIFLETDNPTAVRFARSRGADVVIKRDPDNSNVQIFTSKKLEARTWRKHIYAEVARAEAEARFLDEYVDAIAEKAAEQAYNNEEADVWMLESTWRYHEGSYYCGTKNFVKKGDDITRLTNDQLLDAVLAGLAKCPDRSKGRHYTDDLQFRIDRVRELLRPKDDGTVLGAATENLALLEKNLRLALRDVQEIARGIGRKSEYKELEGVENLDEIVPLSLEEDEVGYAEKQEQVADQEPAVDDFAGIQVEQPEAAEPAS